MITVPFARNWVEELILEWLLLKGYLAVSNIRLRSGRRGGVKEADVIGLRLTGGSTLEIIHVETGCLTGSYEGNLRVVRNKFTADRVEIVKKISLSTIKLGGLRTSEADVDYRAVYVASYIPKTHLHRIKEDLRKHGISFLTLKEVMCEVVRDISDWKKRQVKEGLRASTGKGLTLPESFWLLNLVDFLRSNNLLSIRCGES